MRNIFASQFLYGNTNQILHLQRLSSSIQSRKNKKIHYFYLGLLTKHMPYSKKFHLTEKNTSLQGTFFLKTKFKKHVLQVNLKQRYQWTILREVLWHIIAKQTNAEKTVWTYDQLNIKINIPFVPLTPRTFLLQAKNNYFPNLPVTLTFSFPFTTAFQKLFFLRLLKFLSPAAKIKNLDLLI